MAEIHARAFAQDRGWSMDEFATLLAQPHTHAFTHLQAGFALTRTLAGESELLTLAVDEAHRRKGIASALLRDWLTATLPDADTAFLEVAADNTAALALYRSAGFLRSGLRKAYYTRPDSRAVDAVLMTRALTRG